MADDTYDLAANQTLDRREMQCPRCFEYRLEEHPERASEFSGRRDTVVFATRCANEACPVDHVDPEDIKKQTPSRNIAQRFVGNFGVISTLLVVAVVGVAVLVGALVTGLAGPPQSVDVTVAVVDGTTGSGVEDIAITVNETTQTSPGSGRVTFESLGPNASYTLFIAPDPTSEYAAPPNTTLHVTDGSYEYETGYDGVTRRDELGVVLPRPYEYSDAATAPTEAVTLPFANPHNADRGVTLRLHGAQTASRNQSVSSTGDDVLFTPSDTVTDQRVTVNVPVTEESWELSGTTTGLESLSIEGNLDPEDAILYLDSPTGEYPDVVLDEEVVCSSERVATLDGSCPVPTEYLDQSQALVQLEGGADEYEYEFTYTARAVAEEVDVVINDETYTVTQDAGTVADDGTWEATIAVDAVEPRTENQLRVLTGYVGQVAVDATATLQFERESPPPRDPTVYVEAADGTTHAVAVPDEALTETGVLVGSYEMDLDPDLFAEGVNTITVDMANDGVLQAQVEAELGVNPEEFEFEE